MCSLRDWGSESSTLYKIKGLLSPVAIADVQTRRKLFKWSARAGSKQISGPNPNKWFSMWSDEFTSRASTINKGNEQALGDLTKRVNRMLPNRIDVTCDGVTLRVPMPKLSQALT